MRRRRGFNRVCGQQGFVKAGEAGNVALGSLAGSAWLVHPLEPLVAGRQALARACIRQPPPMDHAGEGAATMLATDEVVPLAAGFAMATEASISAQTLLEAIDVQQNELLDQLDALNARLELVLKECLPRSSPLGIAAETA